MKTCAVVLKLESGNAKGLVYSDAGQRLLFAEAEEPVLAADQIRDYCRGHRLDVQSIRLSISVEEREVKSAAQAARKMITRIAGRRRAA